MRDFARPLNAISGRRVKIKAARIWNSTNEFQPRGAAKVGTRSLAVRCLRRSATVAPRFPPIGSAVVRPLSAASESLEPQLPAAGLSSLGALLGDRGNVG